MLCPHQDASGDRWWSSSELDEGKSGNIITMGLLPTQMINGRYDTLDLKLFHRKKHRPSYCAAKTVNVIRIIT